RWARAAGGPERQVGPSGRWARAAGGPERQVGPSGRRADAVGKPGPTAASRRPGPPTRAEAAPAREGEPTRIVAFALARTSRVTGEGGQSGWNAKVAGARTATGVGNERRQRTSATGVGKGCRQRVSAMARQRVRVGRRDEVVRPLDRRSLEQEPGQRRYGHREPRHRGGHRQRAGRERR